jgi:lysozyme
MKTSQNGLNLIEQSEGVRLTAYQDSVGVWTIGYGHTGNVVSGEICTLQQANEWLAQDVSGAEYVVNTVVTAPLNQNQFDALVDFVFNLGSGNFQSSTLLKLLNSGDYAGASAQFPLWNHAGGVVVAGLTTRRLAEQALFNTPISLPPVQPTPAQPQSPVVQSLTLVGQLQAWVKALQGKFSSN